MSPALKFQFCGWRLIIIASLEWLDWGHLTVGNCNNCILRWSLCKAGRLRHHSEVRERFIYPPAEYLQIHDMMTAQVFLSRFYCEINETVKTGGQLITCVAIRIKKWSQNILFKTKFQSNEVLPPIHSRGHVTNNLRNLVNKSDYKQPHTVTTICRQGSEDLGG